MPTYETSINVITALLKPEARCAMLFAMASIIVGAESSIETTLELTNRICDRYFAAEASPRC